MKSEARTTKLARRIDAWGDPGRYYADPNANSDADPILDKGWERTVEAVAPKCSDTVARSVQLWNQKIRNQLTNEMGFQLRRRHVPVRIHDGLPIPLRDILGRVGGLEPIVLNQSLLRSIVAGTRFMETVRPHVTDPAGRIVGPRGQGISGGSGRPLKLGSHWRRATTWGKHFEGSVKTCWGHTSLRRPRSESTGWQSACSQRFTIYQSRR